MKLKIGFSNYFKDDELMFKVSTGLKFVIISLVFTLTILLFTYFLANIDLIYFIANGYPGVTEFKDAFYDFIFSALIDEIPYIFLAMIGIFFCGHYLATIMIRPFKEISRYCEARSTGGEYNYSPDYFSDLKLLTSFSVFFFSHIDNSSKKGKLEKIEIPYDYTRIHKPIVEKNFFFNYLFIIIIFGLLASIGVWVISNTVNEQVIQFSHTFIQKNNSTGEAAARYFIEEQFTAARSGIFFFLFIHISTYVILGMHFYGKISAPAFAIFATMRSFLKGSYYNRIHLIGYAYLREDCRKINKYLDQIQKTLT